MATTAGFNRGHRWDDDNCIQAALEVLAAMYPRLGEDKRWRSAVIDRRSRILSRCIRGDIWNRHS